MVAGATELAPPAAGLRLPMSAGGVLLWPVSDKLLRALSLWSVTLLRTLVCPVPVVELSLSSGMLLGRAAETGILLPAPIMLPKADVNVLLSRMPRVVETLSEARDGPCPPDSTAADEPGGKEAVKAPCVDPEPNIPPVAPLPEFMPLLLGKGALGVVAAEPSELVLLYAHHELAEDLTSRPGASVTTAGGSGARERGGCSAALESTHKGSCGQEGQ